MHPTRAVLLSATALLLLGCQRDADLPTALPAAGAQPDAALRLGPQQKARLERLSTMAMLLTARELDVTRIRGKALGPGRKTRRSAGGGRLGDVPIATHLTGHENEPTVAANPKRKRRLVAGYHFITTRVRCQARRSSDGGRTWSAPVMLPQLTAQSQCSDPVLAYSPDGRRLFYAYMDIKFSRFGSDFDILVSYSPDDGATWIGPFVALDGAPGVFDYDKPWIGTPDDASRYVYVSATRFDNTGNFDCHIAFTRSTNGGTSYGPPQLLDGSTGGCGAVVVQGSRPAGGKRGNVLVAWYHSDTDGWLTGSFRIRARHSSNSGASFGAASDAARDAFEAPFWKGPFACYERWWGSMFPDVELDPAGGAHIGYTHDPVAGDGTAEEGDVRYVRSPGPPYTRWSAAQTVNDDGTGSAQGYVALDVKSEGRGQSARPHAVWEDHRLPLELVAGSQCPFGFDVENLEYDIFYSTRQGRGWSPNVRVSDRPSLSDFVFNGDYIDLTTTNGSLFAVWTDRRDKRSEFDLEDDVRGSRTHRVLVAGR